MNNNFKIKDEDKHDFFSINLAYAGSKETDKKEFKKMLSAMVVEYIHRGDISEQEKEDIWDELIDLAIDYMKYLLKHYDEVNKDERKDS